MPLSPRTLLLFASVGLLAACQGADETPEASRTPSAQVAAPALPVAEPPLDRSGLLLAVAQAASDFAAGRDDAARQRALDGRLFEVALRFGCSDTGDDTRLWSFDASTRVLRVRVEPELTASSPEVSAFELGDFEAIEGFWIRRPWLLEAACPAAPARAGAPGAPSSPGSEEGGGAVPAAEEQRTAPAIPRIGIAHFYTEEDSRTLRREDRAYQATKKLATDEEPSENGYDLVLSGRLSRMPDGRTIACAGRDPARPPTCIVSVTFDRVSLRRADGELVAEWSSG